MWHGAPVRHRQDGCVDRFPGIGFAQIVANGWKDFAELFVEGCRFARKGDIHSQKCGKTIHSVNSANVLEESDVYATFSYSVEMAYIMVMV
jgi:hypothetical protein